MRDRELAFLLDEKLCIQCHACENGCRTWRGVEPGIDDRKVYTLEEGFFPNTSLTYVSLSCMHCVDPACVSVCPVGAIEKRDDGSVVTDRTLCVGCGVCRDACPMHIPVIGTDNTMRKCDLCAEITVEGLRAPCVRMCPTKALRLEQITVDEKLEQERKIRDFYLAIVG